MKFISGLIGLLAILSSTFGQRPITITTTTSGASIIELEYQVVNGEYQIDLLCQGNPAMDLRVRSVSGANTIRYLYVRPVRSGSIGRADLIITENGGTFPLIRTVSWESTGTPSLDAELSITATISGNLGDPSSPHADFLFADAIGNLTIGGAISADLYSGPAFFSAGLTTGRIRSLNSNIVGDVFSTWGIQEVTAYGSIGSSGNMIAIEAGINGIIGIVKGSSIWADITTGGNGATGAVQRVETIRISPTKPPTTNSPPATSAAAPSASLPFNCTATIATP